LKKKFSLKHQGNTECKSQAGQTRESGGGTGHDQGRKKITTVFVSSHSELGATFEGFEILRVLSMGTEGDKIRATARPDAQPLCPLLGALQ